MATNNFIDKLTTHAIKVNKTKGIKASLAIAQACLESGYGKYIPKNSFNIFGIKWTGPQDGDYIITKTREFKKNKWVVTEARFRKYKSYYESLDDYAEFLIKNKRYKAVLTAKNGIEACEEIQKAGYATDPDYAKKLISILNKYSLQELDVGNMNIIIIDKKGQTQEISLEKTRNINGHIFFEGRSLVEIAGGKVNYDDKKDTAIFDFS